ncbi:glycosyltransferase family 2 protein [Thermodesulfobacteriota bacterium]
MISKYKYIIISPVRNEEDFIEKTILSVTSQTIIPFEWIVVDDGSTDDTLNILERYASQFAWITVFHRNDRGFRQAGRGVIEAFKEGYNVIQSDCWDFIVKLDGDLSFSNDYFERCFSNFDENLKLGIGGGTIHGYSDGNLTIESKIDPIFHVRGACKIYRKYCWEDIDGLLPVPGWDTLDELKANMLGWETRSFSDLKIIHYRHAGTAEGAWKNWVKNGRANYISGYHPLFMLFKCLRRLLSKPYIIQSFGLLYGFIGGYFSSESRIDDEHLIKYIRKQQFNRLLMRNSIWKY